jgi:protein-tyrosine kinase
MSRIHDALRKAEVELATEAKLQRPLHVGSQRPSGALQQPGVAAVAPEPSPSFRDGNVLAGPLVAPASEAISRPDGNQDAHAVESSGDRVIAISKTDESEAATSSLTSELLREQCPQAIWQPDPGAELPERELDATISREEFRRLRAYLYEVRKKQPLRKLLISSALSGEGKTFVSANLAQTMAFRPGDSVLVVDGDLRLSRLHRPLGASAGPGLCEYLQGEADLFSVIQRGPAENLFFVAGGTPRRNPADLISNGRLEELVRRLAPAFDWIVMDSPPALLVADASVLASFCDGVLLVVRVGLTPFDMAQKALQMFRNKRLLGTVLNGSRPKMRYAKYYAHSRPEAG